MRRLIALMCLLILVAPAGAQLEVLAKTTPDQRARAQTAYMQTLLALTTDQTAQVATLNLRYSEKAEPIIKGSAWAMTKASELRTLQKEKEAELKPILTPDQQKRYEAGKDAMKTAVEARLAKQVNPD